MLLTGMAKIVRVKRAYWMPEPIPKFGNPMLLLCKSMWGILKRQCNPKTITITRGACQTSSASDRNDIRTTLPLQCFYYRSSKGQLKPMRIDLHSVARQSRGRKLPDEDVYIHKPDNPKIFNDWEVSNCTIKSTPSRKIVSV
jgi:hypothetical protein